MVVNPLFRGMGNGRVFGDFLLLTPLKHPLGAAIAYQRWNYGAVSVLVVYRHSSPKEGSAVKRPNVAQAN